MSHTASEHDPEVWAPAEPPDNTPGSRARPGRANAAAGDDSAARLPAWARNEGASPFWDPKHLDQAAMVD